MTDNIEILSREIYYRLPYGLLVYYDKCEEPVMVVKHIDLEAKWVNLMSKSYCLTKCPVSEVRMFLRPMSSMTNDERSEYRKIAPGIVTIDSVNIPNFNKIEWLLQRRFDFRDWIGERMAIAVTDEFNPYKEPFEDEEREEGYLNRRIVRKS